MKKYYYVFIGAKATTGKHQERALMLELENNRFFKTLLEGAK